MKLSKYWWKSIQSWISLILNSQVYNAQKHIKKKKKEYLRQKKKETLCFCAEAA